MHVGQAHVRRDDGAKARAGVTADAKRMELRRRWRARAAPRPRS